MKSSVLSALLGLAVAEPLIHPDTGLAITTTGYHWYGQEPLALAQTGFMPIAPENKPQNLAVVERNANKLELA